MSLNKAKKQQKSQKNVKMVSFIEIMDTMARHVRQIYVAALGVDQETGQKYLNEYDEFRGKTIGEMDLLTSNLKYNFDHMIMHDIGSVMATIKDIDTVIKNMLIIRDNAYDFKECIVILPCAHIFCEFCHKKYENEMCMMCKKNCVIYFAIPKPVILTDKISDKNEYISLSEFISN